MQPGKIDGATRALGAPPDWDPTRDGECDTLEIRDVDSTPPRMESAWYPSDEEKRLIMEGKPVVLTVWGLTHPPVSVNVYA